jgi:hypothetical protein
MASDPARAALVIANADDAAVVSALKAQMPAAGVVLLGHSDQGTGWPLVPRPLSLQALITAARRQLALAHTNETGGEGTKPGAREGGWFRRFGKDRPVFSDTQPFALEPVDAEEGFAQTRQFAPESPQESPAAVSKPLLRREPEDFEPTRQFSPSVPSVTPSDWENEVAEWETAQSDRPVEPMPRKGTQDAAFGRPSEGPDSPDSDGDTLPAPLAAADRVLIVGLPGSAAAGLIRVLEGAGYDVDFAGESRSGVAPVDAARIPVCRADRGLSGGEGHQPVPGYPAQPGPLAARSAAPDRCQPPWTPVAHACLVCRMQCLAADSPGPAQVAAVPA